MSDVLRDRRHEPVQPAAGLPRHARRHRRHPAHQGRRDAFPRARPIRHARGPRSGRSCACRTRCRPIACSGSCASGAATRRSSWTRPAAVVGMITLEDVLGELLGQRARTSSRRRACCRCASATDASGCPAICRSSARGSGSKGRGPPTTSPSGSSSSREIGRVPEPGERLEVWELAGRDRERRERPDRVRHRHAAATRRRRGARARRTDMLVPILIIIVLLLVNAFFVVAEFAIVGVPRSAIDARASRARSPREAGAGRPRRSEAEGSLHRHGADRHHGRQPRARHVRRARRRRLDPGSDRRAPPGRSGSRRTASPASSPSRS